MSISGLDATRASRRDRDDDVTSPALPATLRQTPAARRASLPDESRHSERQLPSSDYLAFLSNVRGAVTTSVAAATGDSRDAAVTAKLDAVRDAFSGPYVVEGSTVTARPMFRMTTHVVAQSTAADVDAIAKRAGVRAPIEARVGQPAPKDLVKITQALIDAGHLGPGPGDLATRIRRMQWDHGIGVDCAGYSKQALIACSARRPNLYAAGSESFRDLDRTRAGSFAKVHLESARPGDLVTLDSTEPGGWGHNVIVYSHVTADANKKATLAANDPRVRDFLASAGPHHVLEVDSSWGAGTEGAECGGYRRDTWLYDASTKCWGSFEPGTTPPVFVTSSLGPADDKLHGAYRPRGST